MNGCKYEGADRKCHHPSVIEEEGYEGYDDWCVEGPCGLKEPEETICETEGDKKMTDSDLIEKWIGEQLKAGKTRQELHGSVFTHGTSVYTLKVRGKKFHLEILCGAVNLDLFEQEGISK